MNSHKELQDGAVVKNQAFMLRSLELGLGIKSSISFIVFYIHWANIFPLYFDENEI